MANRKMVIFLGSICVCLVIAGFVSLNFLTQNNSTNNNSNNNTADGSDNTDYSPSDTNSDSSSTSQDEPSESSIEVPEVNWDGSNITKIILNEDSITVDNQNGVIIEGSTITVTSAGNYSISGTLNDGQVIVDTKDEQDVNLVLNGASIKSTSSSPIYIANSEQTFIILADGTENFLTDNQNNSNNATLYSRDDLIISGTGELTVYGNSNDAIRSNDRLFIVSGTIMVTSVDDGIRGKDYLVIKDGVITINSDGDGLKSDNDEETGKGNISIESGVITITATHGDAIFAQNNLSISGGIFDLISGGGGNTQPNESISTKGLKAGVNVNINGGTFTIDSSDDAIHSNDLIVINDGTFSISSGDDGIHADLSIEINDGTFDITKSYEGIESEIITINNGFIQIVSSDDGINLAEATASSSQDFGGRPGGFGGPGGDIPSENCILYVNGGFISVDSGGDGVDSNGYIEMSNGVLIINGPTSNMNAAIDYGGGSFKLTGGTVVAVGSAGMAQAPSASSTQYYANLRFGSTQPADTLVNIQTASGEDVLTFRPIKVYQSLVFSSSALDAGTYNVYVGGTSTGTSTCGLYEDGIYSEGTNLGNFTIT